MAYIQPTEYIRGDYSTFYFNLQDDEKDLYLLRKERIYDISLLEVMTQQAES